VFQSKKGYGRKSKGITKKKKEKKRLFFHVLQYADPKYNDGWSDEEISKDYGVVYRLKKELERDIPDLIFRIVMRSTYYTWSEVRDAFEREN
jgi:hypothetical protein